MKTTAKNFSAYAADCITSNTAFMARAFSIYSLLITRDVAAYVYRKEAVRILSVAEGIEPAAGRRLVKVPKLPGIDEIMRGWSVYMTLEHLVITNEMMVRIIRSLAREKPFEEAIDFEMDVMPSKNPGPEQVASFRSSVASYEKYAARYGKKRSRQVSGHPVFGPFDVHKWRCMAGFHLYIHRRQMEKIKEYL